MSDVAIRVDTLSKRYRIGGPSARYGTLRDSLVDAVQQPFKRLRGQGRAESQEFWALRDVSFEVKYGEVLGIIGRNGAGKSTLLKILSRITEPTAGRAEIRGRVGSLLEVGTGFHPELTGRENIYLNGAILGMTKRDIERRFDEIVEFAEIAQFLDTPVKRYSSGMYTRLAFSVAAHLEPEVLIVDEVLSVGDAAFQRKSLGKMGSVALQGRTVLFVSHNMTAVARHCHTCMLLADGQVQTSGLPDHVVPEYMSAASSGDVVAHLDVGTPGVALIHWVSITNSSQEPTKVVGSAADFFIEAEISIEQTLELAQIAFAIISVVTGVSVFVTTHMDTRPDSVPTLHADRYRCRARIPGAFLNSGTYAVNLRIWGALAGGPRKSHADAFQAVTFTVEDDGIAASQLLSRRGGVVTPILPWELSPIREGVQD